MAWRAMLRRGGRVCEIAPGDGQWRKDDARLLSFVATRGLRLRQKMLECAQREAQQTDVSTRLHVLIAIQRVFSGDQDAQLSPRASCSWVLGWAGSSGRAARSAAVRALEAPSFSLRHVFEQRVLPRNAASATGDEPNISPPTPTHRPRLDSSRHRHVHIDSAPCLHRV